MLVLKVVFCDEMNDNRMFANRYGIRIHATDISNNLFIISASKATDYKFKYACLPSTIWALNTGAFDLPKPQLWLPTNTVFIDKNMVKVTELVANLIEKHKQLIEQFKQTKYYFEVMENNAGIRIIDTEDDKILGHISYRMWPTLNIPTGSYTPTPDEETLIFNTMVVPKTFEDLYYGQ